MTPTLADLQAYVGVPATRGAAYRKTRGHLVEHAWEDTFAGSSGWWVAITHRDLVVAIAWIAGTREARDRELARRLSMARSLLPSPEAVS